MAVGVDNSLQVLRYQQDESPWTELQVLQLYQKLCAIHIMSDHDQLYRLLQEAPAGTRTRRGRAPEAQKERKFGAQLYEHLREKVQGLSPGSKDLDKYGEILLLKAIVADD